MSNVQPASRDSAVGRPAWGWIVGRGAAAAVIAIIITLTANHTRAFTGWTFGVWALANAIALVGFATWGVRAAISRWYIVGAAGVTAVAGVASIAWTLWGGGAQQLLISSYVATCGALELYAGWRLPEDEVALRRDMRISGLIGIAACVALAFAQENSVWVPGLFGAYAAVLAVHLLISGFGMRMQFAARPVAVDHETRNA